MTIFVLTVLIFLKYLTCVNCQICISKTVRGDVVTEFCLKKNYNNKKKKKQNQEVLLPGTET